MSAFDKGNGMGGMNTGVDLDDLLAQMFMGGMGGMPGMGGMGGMPGRPPRKTKGRDVVHQYEVSLEELYKGKTVKLSSTRNKLCSTCTGYECSTA
jgi:DnaJ family protein A protein 2